MTDVMTTEEKVAGEILQKPEEIRAGGRTYLFNPPSVATLIMVSEAVSRLPRLELDKGNIVSETLRVAKDCRKIGEILAIFLIGAKRIREEEKVSKKGWKRLAWAFRRRKDPGTVDRLASRLLEELSPKEMQSLAVQLITRMQTTDFFGLITFLIESSMTRPTKVMETTASGRS